MHKNYTSTHLIVLLAIYSYIAETAHHDSIRSQLLHFIENFIQPAIGLACVYIVNIEVNVLLIVDSHLL